jgi:hypothetical protein
MIIHTHISPHAWIEHRPRISVYQVKHAWVAYQGIRHPVEVMDTAAFKAVILAACPSTETSMSELMAKAELDIIERWYILLRTTDGKYPIRLYYLKKGVFCE